MNPSPVVSVIIPCFNSAWCLHNLAHSLKPFLSENIEIIFIDDGSSDDSFTLFKTLMPSSICLRQENQGLGATRNKAAEIAKGEFLQLLDADDTLEPGKLEAQVAYAHKHDLDVVYSDWRMVIVDRGQELREPVVHAEATTDIIEALLGGWWFPPNAGLIRRTAFTSIGGCDESLGNTCEDFDLWVRLAIAGFKYGYLPGYFANYYRYTQILSMSRKDPREFFEGEEKIILKALKLLKEREKLTDRHRRATALRLHHLARNVYKFDKQWYTNLLAEIYTLQPNFKPLGSKAYRLLADLLGLKSAEKLAVLKRKLR
jgi:glycosyltransferase involved in cell wall biosynthesis